LNYNVFLIFFFHFNIFIFYLCKKKSDLLKFIDMKRIGLLLTCLILFCGLTVAQNEKLSFNETDHNFGTIGDKEGSVSFDFVVTNKSDAPLLITNVQVTCGCTSPAWTKEPIAPGKTGTISIAFSPANQRGQFIKPVTVFTNQSSQITLRIRGDVVKSENIVKEPTTEEKYPVAIGNYLMKTKELSFDDINFNEKKTITLEVFNNSDKPIVQKVLKIQKYITVGFNPEIIPPRTAATIDVNIEIQDFSLYGDLSDEIILIINGVRQSFPFTANVSEDFSKWTAARKSNAGRISVSNSEINFGNFSSGNSRTLKISNSGNSPLNIHTIKSSDPAITFSKTNFVVNSKEIEEIKINIDSKKVLSDLSATMVVVSNDPYRPTCEIAIKANKKL